MRHSLIVERVPQAQVLAQVRQAHGRTFGVIGIIIGAMLLREKT